MKIILLIIIVLIAAFVTDWKSPRGNYGSDRFIDRLFK